MDNNDNLKPQQTGGLKLMTVFIVVLALHVVVIGGFAVYNLMKGGDTDADSDVATTDKIHKEIKSDSATSDNAQTETAQTDKTVSTPAAETATAPANPPAPAVTASPASTAIAPAPAKVIAPANNTPAAPSAPAVAQPSATASASDVVEDEAQAPTAPAISSKLAPPPEPVPAPASVYSPPLTPIASAPTVHMPASVEPKPTRGHVHQQVYVVKITDSYKKIARAHHVTVAQLKEANHIHGDVLHTGQKLIIPSKTVILAESPTELDASPEFSPSGSTALLTSTSTLSAVPVSHHHIYTVVKGDTLGKIAHKFKTTKSALMAANNLSRTGKLTVGEKLKIPSSESRSARNTLPSQPGQVEAKPKAPSAQLATFVP